MPATCPTSINAPSYDYARLLWAGLSAATGRSYDAPVRSYESLCSMRNLQPWPATEKALCLWVTTRAFGTTEKHQGQLKPDTLQTYLSALRSYHVDRCMNGQVFKSAPLARLVQGARNLFSGPRRTRLPITSDLLTKITLSPISRDVLNTNAAFKLAFAGFLCMGEFTHSKQRAADSQAFSTASLTRSDVRLASDHATVRLKRSKTDSLNQGVTIVVAATGEHNCPVNALRQLFKNDPQSGHSPLFSLASGGFRRDKVLGILKRRLQLANIPSSAYSGHSFRRGAAQHAKDHGLLDEHVQALGRWTSDAFRRYFDTPHAELFRLNKTFQTGRPPPLGHESTNAVTSGEQI